MFLLLILALPALQVFFLLDTEVQGPDFIYSDWFNLLYLVYIPLLATFILFLIGRWFTGVFAYPYSSSLFNKTY